MSTLWISVLTIRTKIHKDSSIVTNPRFFLDKPLSLMSLNKKSRLYLKNTIYSFGHRNISFSYPFTLLLYKFSSRHQILRFPRTTTILIYEPRKRHSRQLSNSKTLEVNRVREYIIGRSYSPRSKIDLWAIYVQTYRLLTFSFADRLADIVVVPGRPIATVHLFPRQDNVSPFELSTRSGSRVYTVHLSLKVWRHWSVDSEERQVTKPNHGIVIDFLRRSVIFILLQRK